MRRALVIVALLAAIASGAGLASALAASDRPSAVLEARVGDRIRVLGQPLGCQIVRQRELGGQIVVDCRRAGALAGTYGTLLSPREAAVVRFRSNRVGQLVVVAAHDEGTVRRCR